MELALPRAAAPEALQDDGIDADAVVALLHEATARTGLRPTLLAIPDFKRDEPGLSEAARRLGLSLLRVSSAALRAEQPRCVTLSARAEAAVGLRSVGSFTTTFGRTYGLSPTAYRSAHAETRRSASAP